MAKNADEILAILDRCCDSFTFPALDNGYFYLAATRLSIYRLEADWAMVIETFGFSPRAGLPETTIQTFSSRLHKRNLAEQYVNREAYERYLATNPHNEYRSVFPVDEGAWQDESDCEIVAEHVRELRVRDRSIRLPNLDEYISHGIELEAPPRVQVYELCRYLADVARELVLSTSDERRVSVLPEMSQLLQLEEWHHPDVTGDQWPSGSETFQQLAQVLATGDVEHYRPTDSPNTHWRNWPDGGRL